MNLAEIYKQYRYNKGFGDKGTTHRYIESYERLFSPFRDKAITLLEIGVAHGHSLKMWREYFDKASIIGIDITRPTLDLTGCEFYRCNQTNHRRINKLFNERKLDIVIDDGSHQLSHQIRSFQHLSAHLRENGLYIIEDIQNPEHDIPLIQSILGECEVIDTRSISGRYDDVLLIWRKQGGSRHPSFKQSITLTTAISGKEFVIEAFLAGIGMILKANPLIHWLVCDTSGNESIRKLVYACAKQMNCRLSYTTFYHGPKDEMYAAKNSFRPLKKYMPKLYNHMMSKVPKCNFVLNIEDDIVPKVEDPVPILLGGFDGETAAVVGVTFNRRLTADFGILQGKLKRLRTEGYSKVKRTPFGIIMMKYKYSQMRFTDSFKTDKSFDNVFGGRIESMGKNIKIAWCVKTRHYFKTKDGLADYVDEVNKPPITLVGKS